MDKSGAIKILNGRKKVSEAGSYELKVTSTTPHTREDGTNVTIVNLAAMTDYHVKQAFELMKAGEYQEATNQALSTNVRPGQDYTPAKGEYVKVRVETFTNKDGIEALGVAGITPVALRKAAAVDFSSFEDEEAGEGEVDINSMSLPQLKAFIAENELDVRFTATTTLAALRNKVNAALAEANSLV